MFKLAYIALFLSATVGCRTPKDSVDTGLVSTDADMDGFADFEDCDDNDATINPDAEEVCDEVDNNCDDQIDEGVQTTFYTDADSDGYGDDEALTIDACEAPEGMVDVAGDCDDSDIDFNPDAVEDDCTDPLDYNCDGSVGYADDDGDGFAACEECDDSDVNVNPGADEYCDGIDNDCDTEVDEDDSVDASTWYFDDDGDTYGDPNNTYESCYIIAGWVEDNTDCDDSDLNIHPGADEYCDRLDNDCDTEVDEDDSVDARTWYSDVDGDSYGDSSSTYESCYISLGWVADDTDCDDGNVNVNPGADEYCDGIDNDCDTDIDEDGAVDAVTWYADVDGDTYGDPTNTYESCSISSGWVASDTDCDDGNVNINPGADEYCDGIDNDCDTDVDEDESVDTVTWYADVDGDTYGDPTNTYESCYISSGWVADSGDCNDSDVGISPSAVEICDLVDNECDGIIDNDADVLGDASSCPAADCEDVLVARPAAGTGNFWIDPDATGTSFETFCDMSSEGGGWTLAANIDDVNDPWLLAQDTTWESLVLRNETVLPSYSTDISVTAKYESWTTIEVTDMYIYYKNDGAYFLCEGLDVNDTLSNLFSIIPSQGDCVSYCTYYGEDRMPSSEGSMNPVGLNCSDPNEGWMTTPSYSGAENARVGGLASNHTCCVYNAWIGAAGDRGYTTSNLNKTWGAYSDGAVADDNIMVFVR